MKNLHTTHTSDTEFTHLIIELMEGGTYSEEYKRFMNDRYIGYVHKENPDDPGEPYVVFQENPPTRSNNAFKKGVRLTELIEFIGTLEKTIRQT